MALDFPFELDPFQKEVIVITKLILTSSICNINAKLNNHWNYDRLTNFDTCLEWWPNTIPVCKFVGLILVGQNVILVGQNVLAPNQNADLF